MGSQNTAGGRGGYLLLLRPDGLLREIAGGSGSDSGRLDCSFGGCGEDLGVGRISGQRLMQVFVMEFAVCGGWLGSRSGVSGRWMSGGFLGGVWEEATGCGEGNCVVGCLGLTGGVSSDQGSFYVMERQWDGGGRKLGF